MPSIVAIDPGTTYTGLVHMDERRIIDAKTIHINGAVQNDNTALIERCGRIADQVETFLALHEHEVVVMEGYQRYPGIKAAASTLHQTPWLCGTLADRLGLAGENIVIQLSGQVLNPRSRGNMTQVIADLKVHRNCKLVYEGQERITNEHLRSAFAHGLYYLRSL